MRLLCADRAGGIADNFNGKILNCWTDCVLNGQTVGDIFSYSVVYEDNNFTNNNKLNQVNATTLNKKQIESSSKSRIRTEDLNIWKEVDGKVVLSQEKRSLSYLDILSIIACNMPKITLVVLFITQILIFLYITGKTSEVDEKRINL